jgi:hypothetical protein
METFSCRGASIQIEKPGWAGRGKQAPWKLKKGNF